MKMKLIDKFIILDDKIKASQAQYDLDREAAKISALSSKILDIYEYFSGEDLGHKPGQIDRAKLEYSPLGEVLNNKTKSKRDKVVKKDKGDKTDKGYKHLIYNSQHTFAKFKDVSDFKEILLDSMDKKLNRFRKKF